MNYRYYFNRKNEAPQVWSVDEGTQGSEINVTKIICHVPSESFFDLSIKVNRDTPTAWFEVKNAILKVRKGVAHFYPSTV